MAMNPDDEMPQYLPTEADEARLGAAAAELRGHTEDRWVEIADAMLINVLRRQRPSHPIRATSPGRDFHVSEQVLVTALHHALDSVAHCEVTGIHIQADRDAYVGVTIVVTAEIPHPLIPLADDLRDLARERLEEILGAPPPDVSVEAMHVHVGDVTKGDPKRQ